MLWGLSFLAKIMFTEWSWCWCCCLWFTSYSKFNLFSFDFGFTRCRWICRISACQRVAGISVMPSLHNFFSQLLFRFSVLSCVSERCLRACAFHGKLIQFCNYVHASAPPQHVTTAATMPTTRQTHNCRPHSLSVLTVLESGRERTRHWHAQTYVFAFHCCLFTLESH